MSHHNKVLPLGSQRGPSLLLLDCCLGLCLQLLRKAPAQQGFCRSDKVGGSIPLLVACNVQGAIRYRCGKPSPDLQCLLDLVPLLQ